MTITEFLQTGVPFLKGIPPEQAAFLAKKIQQEPYKKGQTIIFAGTSVEGLNIVGQGKVSVMIRPGKGKPFEEVAQLGPGDVFGETSIVEFKMAGAQIKSAEDNTLVFVVPQIAFREMLDQNPSFKERTLKLIEERQAARHSGDKREDALKHDDESGSDGGESANAAASAKEQAPPPAEQPSQAADPRAGQQDQQQ
jgi:CRP-like cAMP-binding protein